MLPDATSSSVDRLVELLYTGKTYFMSPTNANELNTLLQMMGILMKFKLTTEARYFNFAKH